LCRSAANCCASVAAGFTDSIGVVRAIDSIGVVRAGRGAVRSEDETEEPMSRGLHSSTSGLNVSTFYGPLGA
jgi:hypothetical protein